MQSGSSLSACSVCSCGNEKLADRAEDSPASSINTSVREREREGEGQAVSEMLWEKRGRVESLTKKELYETNHLVKVT